MAYVDNHEPKIYYIQNFTVETGVQDLIHVHADHTVSVSVKAGASDDVSVVIDYVKDGPLTSVITEIDGEVSSTSQGTIHAIGLDILTNVSNDISLEIKTALRA